MSILFVDQVGSTARADGSDPEDIRDLNRRYYEVARSRIERHGGLLEKYAGDAVMAVFGAPRARSNDAEQAVRAGLAIVEGIDELNRAQPGFDLEVRVGVCTGEAVVEIDPAPESSLATGDVVNVAARLETAAAPGTVLVGPETYQLTRQVFRYRELAPIEARGKRQRVRAWLVEGLADSAPGRAESRTPLVGRDVELSLLRTVWLRAVREQQPQLVSLVGPAGIGKSRLAAEFSVQCEAAGHRILWGRCLAHEQKTPYYVVAQLVRQAGGTRDLEPVDTARERLAAWMSSLFPPSESVTMTKHLSLVMGLGYDERARLTVDIHYAARRLFERLSEEGPLIVVLDDLQWADETSLDLIDYLSTRIRDHPVAIVALARPELLDTRPTWGSGVVAHSALVLNPLSPADANEAVARLLPGALPVVVERVVATAEGNPLFIEELVGSIKDETSADELPPTVHAVIAARIDALPTEPRAILLRAAVVGKSFWRGVLNRMASVYELDANLDALEARGLIVRQAHSLVEGDVEFVFKHDLILDVAYATLPRASRRELHAATAAALEAELARPADLAAVLAYHWKEGGEPARACEYLLTAAERAVDALAVEEANELYSAAIELARDDAEQVQFRLRRAHAMVQLEEFSRARHEFSELIPALVGTERVEALIGQAHAALWTEQTEETMACAVQAREFARAAGLSDLEAVAIGLVASAHGMRGDAGDLTKAIELGEEALRAWRPDSRRWDLAELHHLSTDHYYWSGDYPRAMEEAQLSATTAGVELHSQEFLLRGAGMQSLILAGMGRYEEALVAADDALALAREMGRPVNVIMNYSTLALREILAVEEAVARSEEVADRLGPSDFNMPWMNARADCFAGWVMSGEVRRATRAWDALWEDALGSKAWERWLVSGRLAALRAELDLFTGRSSDSLVWAQRAIDMAASAGRRKYLAVAGTTLGRALTASGLGEAAVSQLRKAVGIADSIGTPALRWPAHAALAEALAAAGADPSGTWATAVSVIDDMASGLAPARAARFRSAPSVEAVLSRM